MLSLSSSCLFSRSFLPRKVCIAAAQAIVSRGKKQTSNANNDKENSNQNHNPNHNVSTKSFLHDVVNRALQESNLSLSDLDGIVSVPSLADPHFMEAHYQATQLGLFDLAAVEESQRQKTSKSIWCRTIDTGGAGPISAINAASTLIQANKAEVVAVIAVDAVGSLDSQTFSQRADQSCQNKENPLPSPVIPHGYDKITQYQMSKYGNKQQQQQSLSRDQLRLVPVLESIHAALHPDALTNRKLNLQEVQESREIAPNISLLECARRADGGACIILASNHFLREKYSDFDSTSQSQIFPVILGTGEASGPLYPPQNLLQQDQEQAKDQYYFSCENAMQQAYEDAQLSVDDIDFFGLYDCFPICLVRALEASGLAQKGGGGEYIERSWKQYEEAVKADEEILNLNQDTNSNDIISTNFNGHSTSLGPNVMRLFNERHPTKFSTTSSTMSNLTEDSNWKIDSAPGSDRWFPINTHGGLLTFGAPWEVPAAFNVVEAVQQLKGLGKGRKIKDCRRALVYGNGGIFSSSAVCIIGRGRYGDGEG